MSLHYNHGKANIVADAVRRLCMGSVAHDEEERQDIAKDVHLVSNIRVPIMRT